MDDKFCEVCWGPKPEGAALCDKCGGDRAPDENPFFNGLLWAFILVTPFWVAFGFFGRWAGWW